MKKLIINAIVIILLVIAIVYAVKGTIAVISTASEKVKTTVKDFGNDDEDELEDIDEWEELDDSNDEDREQKKTVKKQSTKKQKTEEELLQEEIDKEIDALYAGLDNKDDLSVTEIASGENEENEDVADLLKELDSLE